MIGAVNRDSEVLLDPRRVEHGQLEAWLRKQLEPADRVVIEATTNAWHVYDLIKPLVTEVVVANPMKVKQIAYARIKTDKLDVLILARLLAANLIPTVWVPPMHVRELRSLVSQRRRLVQMHTQVINRLHSVSHRHHLGHPKGKRFLPKDCAWQKDARLSSMEKLPLELDMATRIHLKTQIDRLTQEMATLSLAEPWEAEALYLLQMPGFGVVTTMTVLAAIGDITRFSHPKKLVHQRRPQGATLGDGRSRLALPERQCLLESTLRNLQETYASQSGHHCRCPALVGHRLALAQQAGALSPGH